MSRLLKCYTGSTKRHRVRQKAIINGLYTVVRCLQWIVLATLTILSFFVLWFLLNRIFKFSSRGPSHLLFYLLTAVLSFFLGYALGYWISRMLSAKSLRVWQDKEYYINAKVRIKHQISLGLASSGSLLTITAIPTGLFLFLIMMLDSAKASCLVLPPLLTVYIFMTLGAFAGFSIGMVNYSNWMTKLQK